MDVPATKVELDHGVSPGLWMDILLPGLVPVYEEHLTRLERGIGIDEWYNLSVDEKAMVVAIRRIAHQLKNLQTEAEIRESESKNRQ